jgi:ABC-type amino acid transport system permease subunit
MSWIIRARILLPQAIADVVPPLLGQTAVLIKAGRD